MADQQRLRDLHDEYVWEVNAAVGEDRLDLVGNLADDYMDRALRLLSAGEPTTCGSPDCAVCTRSPDLRPPSRRRGSGRRRWLR